MKSIGGYQDPLVFCHMSHFQEPSPKRYSLTERSFRVAWNRLTLPQIFSTANLIIVVTPSEKEAKVKMGAEPEKCFLFPGGVDEGTFQQYVNVDSMNFPGIEKGTKIVTYVGSLEERKNPMAVLEVAKKLQERKDIHFIIAGRGGSSYSEKVIETANDLPNVTYLGEITEEEKVRLIKASYLNILMSRLEALGLAQIEFMYLGVPVVTSAVGGQAWLIRNGLDGIHVNGPDDIDGAVKAVEKQADSPTLRKELSVNAKEQAASLTVPKLVSRLDEAITKELFRERGLTEMPSEVRVTLAEPESVLKSWSSGSSGVIATKRRLFIRRGIISRKVIEIPYGNITSIAHMRRYSWKTLLMGSLVSLLLLIEPLFRPIFSTAFVARIEELIRFVFPSAFLQSPILEAFLDILPAIPLIIAAIVFLVQARTGFVLRGPGIDPLYLPRRFQEVAALIRSVQDGQVPTQKERHSDLE
jgi:hypothetical protein